MAARGALRRVLWNEDERRPRAPWRIGLGTLVVFLVGAAGVLLAAPLADPPVETAPTLASVAGTAGRVAPLVAFTIGVLVAGVVVDRRRLRDFGLARSRAWWADLGFGLALGVALPALVLALELALGFARVTGALAFRPGSTLPVAADASFALALSLTLAYFVAVGVFEELLFRGYLLTNVAEGLDGWAGIGTRGALAGALAVTSLLFGLGHGSNPGATPLAVVVIVLYGALLAATVLLTARIAVAVGFHVAWNFAVSSVFGFPVSGVTTPVTVVAVRQTGPPVVTGGDFGPEGGLLALVALAVGALALGGWVRWREGDLRWRGVVARPTLRSGSRGDGGVDADDDGDANRTDEDRADADRVDAGDPDARRAGADRADDSATE